VPAEFIDKIPSSSRATTTCGPLEDDRHMQVATASPLDTYPMDTWPRCSVRARPVLARAPNHEPDQQAYKTSTTSAGVARRAGDDTDILSLAEGVVIGGEDILDSPTSLRSSSSSTCCSSRPEDEASDIHLQPYETVFN